MTTKQFNEKFNEIAGQVPAMLEEFKRSALKSGAVDLESEGDNYLLPKQILYAALQDVAAQWRPHTSEGRDNAENIAMRSYPDYTKAR